MTSKKYNILLGVFMLLSFGAFAQVGGFGSVYDSSVISAKNMPQQTEFWNNTYNFPAKPRSQWEVGASIGFPTVSGDVQSTFGTMGFEVHVRKSLGYLFSIRAQYLNGNAKGISWLPSFNYGKNLAWKDPSYFPMYRTTSGLLVNQNSAGLRGASSPVYYNYKTHIQDLGLQGIITLNNIRFHKKNTGIVIYGGAGVGITAYNVMVNAGNSSGSYASLFQSVLAGQQSGLYANRKSVLKALKAGMDKTYETTADNERLRRMHMGKNTLMPTGTVLMGMAFKLSNRVNLALEDRWTFIKTDLLDGQQWQEHAQGDAVMTRDFDSYNYVSAGLNFNLGAKAVQPLWWLNPLDYAYDELMNHRHVKIPKYDCPDSDGDGVCDHLDREPNTPAGCPVDTHGVSIDTDGDGVPDCKDKEKITPTACQPVDADGVGHCPDPKCCTNPPAAKCTVCDYPSLNFKGSGLSADNKAMLATVAAKLKANPLCNIAITGYPETSKASQANCNRRMDDIKKYLTEKEGITGDRITTECKVGGGDKNTVDIKCNQ